MYAAGKIEAIKAVRTLTPDCIGLKEAKDIVEAVIERLFDPYNLAQTIQGTAFQQHVLQVAAVLLDRAAEDAADKECFYRQRHTALYDAYECIVNRMSEDPTTTTDITDTAATYIPGADDTEG